MTNCIGYFKIIFRKFIYCQDGVIFIITALMLPIIMLFMGAGFDTYQASAKKAILQKIVYSACMRAIKADRSETQFLGRRFFSKRKVQAGNLFRKKLAQQVIDTLASNQGLVLTSRNVVVRWTTQQNTVDVAASMVSPVIFTGFLGLDHYDINVSSRCRGSSPPPAKNRVLLNLSFRNIFRSGYFMPGDFGWDGFNGRPLLFKGGVRLHHGDDIRKIVELHPGLKYHLKIEYWPLRANQYSPPIKDYRKLPAWEAYKEKKRLDFANHYASKLYVTYRKLGPNTTDWVKPMVLNATVNSPKQTYLLKVNAFAGFGIYEFVIMGVGKIGVINGVLVKGAGIVSGAELKVVSG